ncbi:MAG TPA: KEOPS complex subunit Cgi121 [Candidatus Nitrosotalea sp.]|nr:KEOPS complex subunit Cgi121 [Candidatus Nitrosotalea sp.]
MITVRLLGGAKRSFQSGQISVDKSSISVSDLLAFLQKTVSKGMPAFDARNVLVAVNGVDSSALKGQETILEDGDLVSIIPVVHGGSQMRKKFRVSGQNVELIRTGRIRTDPTDFLDLLRKKFPELIVQAIRAKYVLSSNHARRVIEVSMEARARGTMLSNKIETDMLMRFAASRQISDAIRKAGLQKGEDSILIVIGPSTHSANLYSAISDMVKPLEPFPMNDSFIRNEFKISKKELDCIQSPTPLEDLLIEKSAVLLH